MSSTALQFTTTLTSMSEELSDRHAIAIQVTTELLVDDTIFQILSVVAVVLGDLLSGTTRLRLESAKKVDCARSRRL